MCMIILNIYIFADVHLNVIKRPTSVHFVHVFFRIMRNDEMVLFCF